MGCCICMQEICKTFLIFIVFILGLFVGTAYVLLALPIIDFLSIYWLFFEIFKKYGDIMRHNPDFWLAIGDFLYLCENKQDLIVRIAVINNFLIKRKMIVNAKLNEFIQGSLSFFLIIFYFWGTLFSSHTFLSIKHKKKQKTKNKNGKQK